MLPELDGLRAVAAFGILTTHVAFQTGTGSALLERFDFFVPVFYALSAFLLARGGQRPGYYRRRVARIAPAYLVCVAGVLGALPPLSTVSAGQAAANLAMAQIYVPGGLIDGLTHIWSLCVEVAFYLFLPLYLRLGQRGRWAVTMAAVPLGLCWPWLVQPFYDPAILNLQIWPPSFAPWFAVGLVLAELERLKVRYSGPRWPFPLCGLVVAWFAGLIGPPGLIHPTPHEFNARVICGTIFAACFVAPFALGPRLSGTFLSSRPMVTLGRWSYSIFLWHMSVLYFAFPVLGLSLFDAPFVPTWVFTAVVSAAVSYVSYELVEVPGARFVLSGWSGKARHATAKQPASASIHVSPA